MTAVPLAIAAAADGLVEAITWPPPWYVVAWDDGQGGLHIQPVDGRKREACARAAQLLIGGRVANVWVVALEGAGAKAKLVMALQRSDGATQGLL